MTQVWFLYQLREVFRDCAEEEILGQALWNEMGFPGFIFLTINISLMTTLLNVASGCKYRLHDGSLIVIVKLDKLPYISRYNILLDTIRVTYTTSLII